MYAYYSFLIKINNIELFLYVTHEVSDVKLTKLKIIFFKQLNQIIASRLSSITFVAFFLIYKCRCEKL